MSPLKSSGSEWTATLSSPQMTEQLGARLGAQLVGGEVIALIGELGTGKTVFVRGLASSMGIAPAVVTSPTFTLIQEYPGHPRLIHADLYRLESPTELASIGWHEYFVSSNVMAIEWAERIQSELPHDRLEIRLEHNTRSTRTLVLTATGARSQALLSKTCPPNHGISE